MAAVDVVARYLVFGVFALSALVALASWAVRARHVSPFGVLGKTLRLMSDPVIRPVERRLVRLGGNPVQAGWWLVVVVAVAGVVFLSLFDWLVRTVTWMGAAFAGGPRSALVFLIGALYQILFVALVVRVVAAWFGFFRYARWMRLAYALTDWLVEPIRRFLPPTGALDWSPLLAWLALWVLRQILLSLLAL
jgi:YggT family protein